MFVQFGQTPVRSNQTLPLQVAQQPLTVSFQGDPKREYTLLFYDLSAPEGTYMHYQVSNIKGGDISKGNVIFEYEPPNPPPRSGVHTYVVEVDEQSRRLPSELNKGGRAPVPLDQLRLVAGLTPVSQVAFQVVSPGSFAGPTTRSRATFTTGHSCGCGRKPRIIRNETTGYSCGCGKKPKPIQAETTGYSCGCGHKPRPITFGADNGYSLQATGSSSDDASGTGGQYSIMPTGFFSVSSSTNDYPSSIIRGAGMEQPETGAQSFNRGDLLLGQGTQYNWAGSQGISGIGPSTGRGGGYGLGQDYSGQGSGFLDQNTAYPGLPTGILGMELSRDLSR